MTILIKLRDRLTAQEVKTSMDATANFVVTRMLPRNGFYFLEARVPDETVLRDLLASLRVKHEVLGISLFDTIEEPIRVKKQVTETA